MNPGLEGKNDFMIEVRMKNNRSQNEEVVFIVNKSI